MLNEVAREIEQLDSAPFYFVKFNMLHIFRHAGEWF